MGGIVRIVSIMGIILPEYYYCQRQKRNLLTDIVFKFRMLTITFKPSLPLAGAGLVPAHKKCSTYFEKEVGTLFEGRHKTGPCEASVT